MNPLKEENKMEIEIKKEFERLEERINELEDKLTRFELNEAKFK